MRLQQYVAPVKKITAYNAEKVDNYYKYEKYEKVVEERVKFHYNFFGVLIRTDGKEPVILEEELDDLFQHCFSKNQNREYTFWYVNPKDLIPVKKESENHILKKSIFRKLPKQQ